MKFFSTEYLHFARNRVTRRNIFALVRFFLVLALMVLVYSTIFHFLMAREGQDHSWYTGIYWTLTVMSTLGFGDITFRTDLGMIFSTVVLLSGMVWMLILLPFTFIEFFYEPWMQAQAESRAPRSVPGRLRDHLILIYYDDVTRALIDLLNRHNHDYVLIVDNLDEALRLHDLEVKVMLGDLDNPETYRLAGVDRAALVAATSTDTVNTSVVFTVRQLAPEIPIVATVKDPASEDILQLAGATHVLHLADMMGRALARRVIGGDALSHVIGNFDRLLIAEATTTNTPLVGKTLQESRIRENLSVTVVGIWDRGQYQDPTPDTLITDHSVLVLAGTRAQFNDYDELFAIYNVSSAPIVILGGGRVGRATMRALDRRKIDYRIVEKLPDRVPNKEKVVLGNAAELEVLEAAGLMTSPAVMITPHEDDMNVYLTLYCRRLRPDIQIVSRATLDRNVATMHRAGADFVLSYASMGANAIFNALRSGDFLMFTEGLYLFKIKVPRALAGKSLAEAGIRESSGCTVVAVKIGKGMDINPDPQNPLPPEGDMVLIGSRDAEDRFLERFCGA